MQKKDPAILSEISVSLPFGIGSAKWKADPTERNAAWSLYVELVTRIAVQPLEVSKGLLRESMNSLYTMFATTREVLKQAGPKAGASKSSVGGIAIAVLNNGLRPFLTKWHPLLQQWEVQRSSEISPQEHEKRWGYEQTLRKEFEDLRVGLAQYAEALAKISGVEN